MRFLADSQQFFSMFGYCFHNKDERLPEDRRGTVINIIVSILSIWYYIFMIEFISDSRNSVNDRLCSFTQMVGYSEIVGGHFTLPHLKSKIRAFFDHFEIVLNQSKWMVLIWTDTFCQTKCNYKRSFDLGCQENANAIDFYLNAEKKTTALVKYVAICYFFTYDLLLMVTFLNVVIVKIIWEQCRSDPATWYTLLRSGWENFLSTGKVSFYCITLLNCDSLQFPIWSTHSVWLFVVFHPRRNFCQHFLWSTSSF